MRKKQWIIGGIVVLATLLIGSAVALRNGNGEYERVTATLRDVVEVVEVSGSVEANIVADLGLEVTGRVAQVYAREGDTVRAGQTLVLLDLGTLPAELRRAEADVAIKRAEVENTAINVNAIREQQDILVESAYRNLLSEDLEAEPSSATYTQTPPSITGRYTGEEGEYTIRILQSPVNTNEYHLYTFGIESTGAIDINRAGATPLGTEGLFVNFPDGLASYDDTRWHITIPNTKSASYTANYNAYQEALRERKRAIEEAQAQLREEQNGTSIAEAELARAEADVARIQAEINKRRLIAPFAGIVTEVAVDPGEIANSNEPAVSLISNNGFGVEIDLPEVDSIKVQIGDPANITLDAFGDSMLFPATVVSINRTETIVDGVAVYEARLSFDTPDERIASGMTAEATITTNKAHNVLAVPVRALQTRDDGSQYVLVESPETETRTEIDVSTGVRGSDGFVEIPAGIAEGDIVLIPTL